MAVVFLKIINVENTISFIDLRGWELNVEYAIFIFATKDGACMRIHNPLWVIRYDSLHIA